MGSTHTVQTYTNHISSKLYFTVSSSYPIHIRSKMTIPSGPGSRTAATPLASGVYRVGAQGILLYMTHSLLLLFLYNLCFILSSEKGQPRHQHWWLWRIQCNNEYKQASQGWHALSHRLVCCVYLCLAFSLNKRWRFRTVFPLATRTGGRPLSTLVRRNWWPR